LSFWQNQVSDISPVKDLVNLQNLYFWQNQVSDISPVKDLVNLQNLYFSSNQVSDISPVKDLVNLQNLSFSENQVSDISPLKDLVNLQNLDFSENQVTDISPVKDLVNLQNLYFWQNQVSDISPVKDLVNLQNLYFWQNQVSDISPVKDLVNLKNLYFWQNQVSDISPLKDLVNLQNLDFSSNQVSDISPVKDLVNLQELDFWQNQVSDISPVKDLVNLQELDFWQNQVADISPVKDLVNLQNLNFRNNQVADISPVKDLVNLQNLNFRNNQVADISPVKDLVNLQNLDFSSNQVADISPMKGLANLQNLDFSSNQVSDISPVKDLVNLQELDFGRNQVADISPVKDLVNLQNLSFWQNQVSDISPVKDLNKLYRLVISPNPHLLYIPQALEEKARINRDTKDTAFAQALIQYVLYAHQYNRAIREAKVIFVGDAAVGKTSLIRRFLHGTFDKDSKSTEKIEIHHDDKQFALDQAPLKVHFWDFGGQEIQHSLHKLFMSERSVYVCVTQARTEDKAGESPVEYWLELIRQYGGDSPVVVVVNKCDIKENKNFKFAENKYKEQFPSIHLPTIYTDCETGTGMESLQEALQSALSSLTHVRYRLPEAHFAVKEHLQKENKEYIEMKQFEEICEKAGKEYGFDFQEAETQYLAGLLHDLGTIVYFGEREYDVSSKTVLNPAWISEGMYKVITSAVTKEKNGILRRQDLKAILEGKNDPTCEKIYTKQHEQEFIINTLKNFQLAFEQEKNSQRTFFIPRQFLQEEPEAIRAFWKEKAGNTLIFRYQYSRQIPTEIMARLIVNLHQRIHENMMYREGFVIKDEHTWAYIKANTFEHYINISLTKNPETQYLLYWARQEIKEIHNSFAELKVKEVIVYEEDGKNDEFDYQELKDLLEMGETHKPSTKLKKRIPIATLLGAVEIPPQTLILKLIDEWWISEAFQEIEKALEKQGNERAIFSQIRSEFIQGSRDYNFAHRLKTFVQAHIKR
jgi:small GTP-binding protein